jgi:hypothetical protein
MNCKKAATSFVLLRTFDECQSHQKLIGNHFCMWPPAMNLTSSFQRFFNRRRKSVDDFHCNGIATGQLFDTKTNAAGGGEDRNTTRKLPLCSQFVFTLSVQRSAHSFFLSETGDSDNFSCLLVAEIRLRSGLPDATFSDQKSQFA